MSAGARLCGTIPIVTLAGDMDLVIEHEGRIIHSPAFLTLLAPVLILRASEDDPPEAM